MTIIPSPPVVPPRSRLRSMPAPPAERRSSLYLLPVDPPLETTPSLSSGSSSDQDHDERTPEPSIMSKKRGSGRRSVGGDPLRIRDGAMVRKASSGLYTRMSFPAAHTTCSLTYHSYHIPRRTRPKTVAFPIPRLHPSDVYASPHRPPTYT
jgi:hypothetical protein